MRFRLLTGTVAVGALMVGACGDDGSSGSSNGSTTSRADVLELDLVDCPRWGSGTVVDPEVARDYVPEDLDVFVGEEGLARFAIQVLDCADVVTDGESHGPGRFATAWIAIDPGGEPPTLPASSDLVARPSDYFTPVLYQSDNEAFQQANAVFGIPMTLAESMTFDPPNAGVQTGATTDSEFDPPLSYSWTVDNVNRVDIGESTDEPPVHTLFGLDDQGEPLTYYGEFTHAAGWGGNIGTLTLDSGSAFEDLLAGGFTGAVNGDPVSVEMVVFRDAD